MMKRIFSGLAAALIAGSAVAQDADAGRAEYMSACAGCHGESGLGDGPLAALINIETPDLTQLAANAGGSFPYQETLRIIDGRSDVRAHGSKMPVWGNRYVKGATFDYYAYPEDAELIAQGRLLALVEYLGAIQK